MQSKRSALFFRPNIPFNFSASHHKKEDLDSGSSKKLTQKHVRLLEPQKDIFLNIDGFTSGVGSGFASGLAIASYEWMAALTLIN